MWVPCMSMWKSDFDVSGPQWPAHFICCGKESNPGLPGMASMLVCSVGSLSSSARIAVGLSVSEAQTLVATLVGQVL